MDERDHRHERHQHYLRELTMRPLHALLTLLLLSAVACWPEAQPTDAKAVLLEQTMERTEAVMWDAGLGHGIINWVGVSVRVYPGGSRPLTAEEQAAHPTWGHVAGESYDACPGSDAGTRLIWVDTEDWPRSVLGHELAHVARGCLPDDHEYFEQVGLDAKLSEATADLQLLTGAGGL